MFLKPLCAVPDVILKTLSLSKGQGLFPQLTTKTVRVMQITTILLLAVALTTSAGSNAQRITLSKKNANLQELFVDIYKQTGYTFAYNNENIRGAKRVTIRVTDAPLDLVLAMCFKEQPFTYEIVDKIIVVKQKALSAVEGPTTPDTERSRSVEVRGRLVNEKNEPVAGASVKVKGSTNGSTTNANGEFVLTGVDENATLVFSGTNIETFEKKIGSSGDIGTLTAKIKVASLNEVVVNKGYYSEKQKYSVGNVGRITAAEIERQPVSNVLLALQGRVPGLVITQNSGVPGGGITIRIQGQNSIRNGNDPLIVVNGVPVLSQLPPIGPDAVLGQSGSATALGNSAGGSPLSYINPNDIESIEVLKDADATAIYGSRAANGAILITTKKGKAGKTSFDIKFQQGWGEVTKMMKMLNAREYLDMRYEAYKNDGVNIASLTPGSRTYDLTLWDTTRSTDWQKMLIGGTAKYTNLNASVSGGNSSIQYLLANTYNRETTVFPGNFHNEKASVLFNVSSTLNRKLKLQFSTNFMVDNYLLPGSDLTERANLTEPIAPNVFNSDGTLNWEQDQAGVSTWDNPFVSVLYNNYKRNTTALISNLTVNYSIINGLELRTSFGYNSLFRKDYSSVPLSYFRPEDRPFVQRSAVYGNSDIQSWIIEPQINYKKEFQKSTFEGLVGVTIQQNQGDTKSIQGEGYANDQVLENFSAAVTLTPGSFNKSEYKYNAIFGRLNYNWKGKYLINLNARRDGSSRFGSMNRFQNFGSIGAGWIFSEESVFKKHFEFISFGKLRASYGTSGNDQIGDYGFISLYNFTNWGVPYQNSPALTPGVHRNPYIQWEETKKLQAGIDIGLIKDKVNLSVTYVRNRSSNQLLNYLLPSMTGFQNVLTNFPATVQNSSWEFSISTSIFKTESFSWSSSMNLTVPRNELVSFPNLEQSSYASQLKIGKPLGTTTIFHFLGVDPSNGTYQFSDRHGNPTSSPTSSDRVLFINTLPKFYGGFENRIDFKSIEIDFFFQFIKQIGTNNIFNNGSAIPPGVFLSGFSNQPYTINNRWRQQGDLQSIQKLSADFFGPTSSLVDLAKGSDFNVTDASFIRLKNVSITWNIQEDLAKRFKLRSLRAFIRGQNLLTITNYVGGDPENQGFQALPPLRVITVGAQIGL